MDRYYSIFGDAGRITKVLYQQWTRQPVLPQIYQGQWRELKPTQSQAKHLARGSLLKILSWNINFSNPAPKLRAAALIRYLQQTFNPSHLVIFLQEVSQISAQQIMQTKWIQDNFLIIGHEPPRTIQGGIPRQARYYTMAIIARDVRLHTSFRIPLPSEMGRDALFVDLDLESSDAKEVFRVCTTHLESLQEGRSLRARQLNLLLQNLEGVENDVNVVAGVVGGDMNAIHPSDDTLHKDLRLTDPWEYQTTKDANAYGYTWGYQPKSTRFAPGRLDKFLYRGCIKPEGRIERLGIGLTMDEPLGSERESRKMWVSDHYGIAMGVKIVT